MITIFLIGLGVWVAVGALRLALQADDYPIDEGKSKLLTALDLVLMAPAIALAWCTMAIFVVLRALTNHRWK